MPTLLGGHFDVGISLFFQAVSSQVSSAPLSLTSVFGMGTGGPSASSTPTYLLFVRCRYSFIIISSCPPIVNSFLKFFYFIPDFSLRFKSYMGNRQNKNL